MADSNVADISILENMQQSANVSMGYQPVSGMAVFNAETAKREAEALKQRLAKLWSNYEKEQSAFLKASAEMTAANKSGDKAAIAKAWDQYQDHKNWMVDHRESIVNIQNDIAALAKSPEVAKKPPTLPKFEHN